MLKAEADNSYLDLDYSGHKKYVIVNNFMKFYKNKKTIKIFFV